MKVARSATPDVEGFVPSQSLEIAEPCGESWESMPGDHRRRFCARCGHDVINTAAMTPTAIEAMLAAPGALPCVRLVKHEDGSMLAARAEAGSSLPRLAALAASAFVSLSSLTAGAQETVMGRMMPLPPRATLTGKFWMRTASRQPECGSGCRRHRSRREPRHSPRRPR